MITNASVEDSQQILALQRLAYQSEALLYHDFSIPPLRQTLEELRAELLVKTVLKTVRNDEVIGSVRAWQRDRTCFIERLIVHPAVQGQGIGTELLHEIERRFGDVARFELFTGHQSERNIRLYKSLGYQIFRHQQLSETLTLVYLEKWTDRSQQ